MQKAPGIAKNLSMGRFDDVRADVIITFIHFHHSEVRNTHAILHKWRNLAVQVLC